MERRVPPIVTVLWCTLALLAAGCETLSPPVLAEPSRVVMVPSDAVDFKLIKEHLEQALEARQAGDLEAFSGEMQEAVTAASRLLGPTERTRVSRETVYRFLADRLRDPPAYGRDLEVWELAGLASEAEQVQARAAAPAEEGSSVAALAGLLDESVMRMSLETMFREWEERNFAVDEELLRHVSYFVKYFAFVDAEKTNRALRRSCTYLPGISRAFARGGLREEVAFAVPFVESRFVIEARSEAGALGMFQFLDSTARIYGLETQPGAPAGDQRLDWEKAAGAAARYLASHRNVFASTVLALGAYHHGSEKVVQVLLAETGGTGMRSFAPIFRHPGLGPYSREYIPQCLAAAYLYRTLRQAHRDQLPVFEVHYRKLAEPVPVRNLAAADRRILDHNPDLIHAERIYNYASTGGYLLITEADARLFAEAEQREIATAEEPSVPVFRVSAQDSLPERAPASRANTSREGASGTTIAYRFQTGNSLMGLARLFGVDPIKLLNHPANQRWKARYPLEPNSGDTIIISGLAATTVLIASPGRASDRQDRYSTSGHHSLREIAEDLSRKLAAAAADNPDRGLAAMTISADHLLYWNRDRLPAEVGIDDPLPAGLELFIVSGYRAAGPGPARTAAAVGLRSSRL